MPICTACCAHRAPHQRAVWPCVEFRACLNVTAPHRTAKVESSHRTATATAAEDVTQVLRTESKRHAIPTTTSSTTLRLLSHLPLEVLKNHARRHTERLAEESFRLLLRERSAVISAASWESASWESSAGWRLIRAAWLPPRRSRATTRRRAVSPRGVVLRAFRRVGQHRVRF